MQMHDLKTIDIYIAGKNFPVEITPEEEQSIRSLANTLNQKITEFQNTFPGREKIDYVIMTLLSHTYDLQKTTDELTQSHLAVLKQLQDISIVLDES